MNDNDFDLLVCQIAETKFSVQATRYGRNGQAQHGVDITLVDTLGRLIAIQSKHTVDLTADMMDIEIDKLLGLTAPTKFPGNVFEFIFATSAPRDTKQTNHAIHLAGKHSGLRVSVWPWEQINEDLNRMPSLAGEYCRAVLGKVPMEDVRLQHAKVLRRAFNRSALLDGFRFEQSFSDQSNSLRRISGFLKTGNLYDSNNIIVTSILPYIEDDSYGKDVKSIDQALQKFIRHIETHSSVLNAYALVPGGRVVNGSDLQLMKTYLQYETNRLEVIKRTNTLIESFGLPPL